MLQDFSVDKTRIIYLTIKPSITHSITSSPTLFSSLGNGIITVLSGECTSESVFNSLNENVVILYRPWTMTSSLPTMSVYGNFDLDTGSFTCYRSGIYNVYLLSSNTITSINGDTIITSLPSNVMRKNGINIVSSHFNGINRTGGYNIIGSSYCVIMGNFSYNTGDVIDFTLITPVFALGQENASMLCRQKTQILISFVSN